jgi:ribosomal protein S20
MSRLPVVYLQTNGQNKLIKESVKTSVKATVKMSHAGKKKQSKDHCTMVQRKQLF